MEKMVNTVNAIEDISWIYENGEFQISRWNRYMDNIFPGHKEIFINDMDETIQNGGFTFQKDFLPKLNHVLSDTGKRNEVIESFKKATKGLEEMIIDIFGRAPNVNIILYLGLCNGAGWAMEIDGAQYIMLGIEKIMELAWCDLKSMYGLIYHELGHIYQMQYGILSRNYSCEDRFLWQLFTEGIAMLFEQKLVKDGNFFHQDADGWLQWCEENKEIIKRDFNKDLPTMSYGSQRYFGDWVRYKGHGDVGYYLGSRFVQWINQRYKFDEMICFDIIKVRNEWNKYLYEGFEKDTNQSLLSECNIKRDL